MNSLMSCLRMPKLLLVLLMSSVLLGCAGAIHVKDKKSICLGLCLYTETEATKVTPEGSE